MDFDIAIIGGGMVGAAMAVSLQHTSYKIALIDATTTVQDHRLIALNYSSVCLLKNLNLWTELASQATAINTVHVSQQGRFGTTRLTAAELQLPQLGYLIPAQHINTVLYKHLTHVTLIKPARLESLTQKIDHVDFILDTAKNFTSKILIAADGSYSTVRELLQIPVKKTDYQQRALVTTTELKRSHRNIAYERFHVAGAIAMLPFNEQSAATIWTDRTDKIEQLLQLSDEDFLPALQKEFGYRLGRFQKIGPRYSYPLFRLHAEETIKNRVILLGNALHTVHPIAAQGLNLAFQEVAQWCEYFLTHSPELKPNTQFTATQSRFDLSHNLSWLFSQDFFMIGATRALGMLGLDLCQPLKQYFAQQLLGRTGRTPSLLREQETHESQ